ncbi:hypothetical protein DFJ64_2292 [Thermasporomyces composti]|uniref:Uncharacterized protein n=1 Tax=Thermasporomyces composti TaxID=696763 RepID=A0A3D9V531_THECX|nr:hypothetical protein DFJ64_2292 [Thermasporomyces composti]
MGIQRAQPGRGLGPGNDQVARVSQTGSNMRQPPPGGRAGAVLGRRHAATALPAAGGTPLEITFHEGSFSQGNALAVSLRIAVDANPQAVASGIQTMTWKE